MAPAVGTPVTARLLTGGCVMLISWIDAHPQRDNEINANDAILMIEFLPFQLEIAL
jgi:hypothetical protein